MNQLTVLPCVDSQEMAAARRLRFMQVADNCCGGFLDLAIGTPCVEEPRTNLE
jgi:hypothetical protein